MHFVPLLVAERNMMEPFDVSLLHFCSNRVVALASQAVNASAHKEMRA